jgi:hypothetical protein
MTLDQRAQQARTELFLRYDAINDLWRRAEEQLTKYHIPRPVFYEFPDDPDPEEDLEPGIPGIQCLALAKFNGKWRILFGCYPDAEDRRELGGWKPIVDCSAQERVEAAKHFPGFRLAVIESAEEFISEVDGAKQTLAEALEQEQ